LVKPAQICLNLLKPVQTCYRSPNMFILNRPIIIVDSFWSAGHKEFYSRLNYPQTPYSSFTCYSFIICRYICLRNSLDFFLISSLTKYKLFLKNIFIIEIYRTKHKSMLVTRPDKNDLIRMIRIKWIEIIPERSLEIMNLKLN